MLQVGDSVLARLDPRPSSLWYPATIAGVQLHNHQLGPGRTVVYVYDIVFYDGEVCALQLNFTRGCD